MHIEINEYLTNEQKAEIGDMLFKKMVEHVKSMQFTKHKVNINAEVNQMFEDIFQNGEIYDNVNMDKLGDAVTKQIISAFNNSSNLNSKG